MKTCKDCNKQLEDEITVCPECGSEAVTQEQSEAPLEKANKKKKEKKKKEKNNACQAPCGPAGTVVGVLGIVLPFIGLSSIFVFGALSFIFSFSFISNDVITDLIHFLLTLATAAAALAAIPTGIAGTVLSIIALAKKKSIGTAGLIISLITTVISTLIMAVWIINIIISQIIAFVTPLIIIAILLIIVVLFFFFGMPLLAV